MKTNQGARKVQEQVENGEKVLNREYTGLVLNTALITIHPKLDHECPENAVRLQNAHPIH